jgi:hypothetical protein
VSANAAKTSPGGTPRCREIVNVSCLTMVPPAVPATKPRACPARDRGSLSRAVDALVHWVRDHQNDIVRNRDEFDKAPAQR